MIFDFIKSLKDLIEFIKLDKNKKDYVIFSESISYRYHFLDLILNLKKKGIENIIIIVSDKRDEIFFNKLIKCYYIKNYLLLSLLFNTLECKFMIMTLIDLGYHFQKSKNCQYYVYFFHGLASTHQIYTKTAFKNYDIIFSNGSYQFNELRYAEEKFKFPKKNIINTGYFYLDYLSRTANLEKSKSRNILFAPSWNYNKKNLFDDYAINIIKELLSKKFSVTFRPHPEHYKRSGKIIKKIKDLFTNNLNFSFDYNVSNLPSLETAKILITDNSAIVFEFLLIFKRPIIYINYEDKIHNFERNRIPLKTIEEIFKEKFGNILHVNNIDKLSSLCEELVDKNILPTDVHIFADKYISNIGKSAEYAANYLIKKS